MSAMDVEWAKAVLPFTSALVGAGIAAVVSFLQQHHDAKVERQRRDDEAQRRREEKAEARRVAEEAAREDARIAARIVRADVEQARARLRLAVRKRRYWSSAYSLPQDSWTQYREKLARHLSAGEWAVVSRFFRSVATLDAGADVARAREPESARTELSDRMAGVIERAVSRGDEAIKILARFTSDDPTPDSDDDAADDADL